MKTILLPVHDEAIFSIALETAYRIAQRFDSYLEGLFIRPLPPLVSGEGMTLPTGYFARFAEEGRQRAATAQDRFVQFMQEANIPLRDPDFAVSGPAAGWRETQALASEMLGDYGRLFDLLVIGRGSHSATADWNAMLEGALFESGRPLIVTGQRVPRTLGENVVIAWNGSTETARTLGLGMPLLLGAGTVVVLTVEGGTVPGPTGEQVSRHLIRHGLKATAKTVQTKGRSVGETILEEADALGADLLVKGAYTHSRIRQMIFGGATRHILSAAELPVLIAH